MLPCKKNIQQGGNKQQTEHGNAISCTMHYMDGVAYYNLDCHRVKNKKPHYQSILTDKCNLTN